MGLFFVGTILLLSSTLPIFLDIIQPLKEPRSKLYVVQIRINELYEDKFIQFYIYYIFYILAEISQLHLMYKNQGIDNLENSSL